MPEPSLILPTDDQKQAILEMRNAFQSEFISNPDLYHLKDMERVMTKDWEVHRYLLAADGDQTVGLNRLMTSMKWRKQWGVWDMCEHDFPKEFYQMILLGKALNGSTLVISRAQFYIPLNEWRELFKKFSIFIIESLDRQNTGKGISVLFDLRDSGLFNVDFDFIWFLKPIQSKYYPLLLKRQMNCDIPWILNSVSQLILSLMPEKTQKLMYFIKRSQISKYVAEDNIPIYLGGTGLHNYSMIPSNCDRIENLAQRLSFSKGNIKKLVSHLVPLILIYSK